MLVRWWGAQVFGISNNTGFRVCYKPMKFDAIFVGQNVTLFKPIQEVEVPCHCTGCYSSCNFLWGSIVSSQFLVSKIIDFQVKNIGYQLCEFNL